MGHPKYYSNPPWPGPTNLTSPLAWHFFGTSNVRYEESFIGGALDDKKNLYVSGDRRVYKLSPDGVLQWIYNAPFQNSGDALCIYKGQVFGSTNNGFIYAVDMETGFENWAVQASSHDGGEYSQLAAHQGVLITWGDARCQHAPFPACACEKIRALNTTDGAVLWNFTADEVLWDMFPQFPDDETVMFMGAEGGLYRMKLQTGELLWRTPLLANSWTDGSQFVASNGITYVVQVDPSKYRPPPHEQHVGECAGYVTAFKTNDGSKLWSIAVPKPPNTSPVVGRLGKDGKLALIMGIGQQSTDGCSIPGLSMHANVQSFFGKYFADRFFLAVHRLSNWLGDSNGILWGSLERTHDVLAFEADTGKPLWYWKGPTSFRRCNAGDEDGFLQRLGAGMRPICCPTPWGQPRIGVDGTVFIANENGDFFTLRDANGDGRIDNSESSVYHTGATFPHCGSLHAPGMLVAINFDGVFVWKS
uniref:Pyrrolo-quinoline quinone repeat domain-containing protein n=1 Tax=Alexandrium catenella TaxID=2925 RepID=A0A7S1S0J5_ALECA